jgi:hypothetical protein
VPGDSVWYDRGAFYQRDDVLGGYMTVRAPLGAVVGDLPVHNASIADVNGVLYYIYSGAFFRPEQVAGRTVYVVAQP